MEKYNVGFYGGKFLPLHKGHAYCIDKMAEECEKGYVILFINGDDEEKVLSQYKNLPKYLKWSVRHLQLVRYILEKNYSHLKICVIDCTTLKLEDGSEDWDAETPLVRAICGDKIDAVYSSEISYSDYFARAYPEATHRLVDPPREIYPISGTMCRNMKEKEREGWMV